MMPMLKPHRHLQGISAVLLPFRREWQLSESVDSAIAWDEFETLVQRTSACGLVAALNMDTGFGPQLTAPTKRRVLEVGQRVLGSESFVAGAIVVDRPGDPFDIDGYRRAADEIVDLGGTPIFFPSYGLTSGSDAEIVSRFEQLARHYDTFLAFELGQMFAPFGKVFSLDVFSRLLSIPECVGAKHSSLSRIQEWERLELRDRIRPDFRVFTGNDLAIDMVMYGSDYLLGLSAFYPEAFALRDSYWATGDPRFYELNDRLQYLGSFAFRGPVPAYKHSAAMFLKLRGLLTCDATHPSSPSRPESDREILSQLVDSLNACVQNR